MQPKVIRNQKSIFNFYKQLSVYPTAFLLSVYVLALYSCKPKEKYFTAEEARRIADSAAWEILKPILKDAEENFELRKRVELPHQLGVKNPYVEQNYEPIIPQLDIPTPDSNAPPSDDFKPLDNTGPR